MLAAYTNSLNRQEAVHLLNRLKMCYSRSEVDALVGIPAGEAVDSLLNFSNQTPPEPIDEATGATWVWQGRQSNNSNNGKLKRYTRIWWTDLMIHDTTALEKITYFFHTHFTTRASTVNRTEGLYHQNQLCRLYAKGNFKQLAKKMARDIAMNYFLSGFSNTKNNPNENLGRELLELYTIGKGPQIAAGNYTTYTEEDIREVAKVLTGYKLDGDYLSTDSDTGLLRTKVTASQHDASDKTFSAAFQNTVITGGSTIADAERELDEMITMIFNQQATARHIIKEIYRFFVYPNITPIIEANVIDPLSLEFFNNGYELEPIFKELFKSQHFFDQDNWDNSTENLIGGMIASPLQLSCKSLKYFNVNLPDKSTMYAEFLQQHQFIEQHVYRCGQELYEPTETAGWPAYHQEPALDRSWMSENTVIERFVYGDRLLKGKKANGGNMSTKIDAVAFVDDYANISDPVDPNNLISEIVDYIFPFGVSNERRDQFKINLVDVSDPDYYWGLEWADYKSSGNDMTIRPRLEALLKDILQSPEYQVF